MKKNDILLTAGILLLALLCFCGYRFFYHQNGAYVEVTVNGKLTNTLPLDKDTTLTIKGSNHGTNILKIKNGIASITDADCPDKLCVKQKAISKEGETLVCLPHKVVVSISSDEKNKLDGVAQ